MQRKRRVSQVQKDFQPCFDVGIQNLRIFNPEDLTDLHEQNKSNKSVSHEIKVQYHTASLSKLDSERGWSTWLATNTHWESDQADGDNNVKEKKLSEPSMFHLSESPKSLENCDERFGKNTTNNKKLPMALESVEILSSGFSSTSSIQAMLEGLCSGYYGSEDWESLPTPNISVLPLNDPLPLEHLFVDGSSLGSSSGISFDGGSSSNSDDNVDYFEIVGLQEEFPFSNYSIFSPFDSTSTEISETPPPLLEEAVVTVLLDILVASSAVQVYLS